MDTSPAITRKLAQAASSADADILRALALNENEEVRSAVAGNENTESPLLASLCFDSKRLVREGVAGNPNTPEETLLVLAIDDEDKVRVAVAGNKNTPDEALRFLAADDKEYIRAIAAEKQQAKSEEAVVVSAETAYFAHMQCLVDAAAAKSTHPIKVYRGDADKEFKPGMMVSPDKEYASSFGQVTEYYLTAESPVELSFSDFQMLGGAESIGKMSGLYKLGKSFILTSPDQIKSADPVLTDTNGVAIPLEMRFPEKHGKDPERWLQGKTSTRTLSGKNPRQL